MSWSIFIQKIYTERSIIFAVLEVISLIGLWNRDFKLCSVKKILEKPSCSVGPLSCYSIIF